MIREDVVAYFEQNLKSFPVEELRKQLLAEGVSSEDLEDSLSAALAAPKAAAKTGLLANRRVRLTLGFIGTVGLFATLGGLLFSSKTKEAASDGNVQDAAGESGFIGARGWVVRLPKDYHGFSEFKDPQKRHQVVYFSKRETDPTNFLNQGLYGELGIVKLEVMPSEFPSNPTGLANLSRAATGKYNRAGEKHVMKTIQVATLPGIQVNIQSPFPHVEAYILGSDDLYFFYGGHEDEVWRDILLSLRDARTEN